MNIIGLGNALMDVLLRLENDSVLQELGLPKGVMEMIDEEQMRAIRKAQRHLERSEAPGGSVCNTMRAIALLGTPTGFIGKIGSDPVGRNYEQKLLESGVTPYFLHSEGISGSCTVLISPDGERTMGTFLGPAPDISPEEITDEMLRPYHCIYIEGYLLVNATLVKGVMQQAKRLGMKRILLPIKNAKEVSIIDGLEIIPVSNLNEIIDYLNGQFFISPEPISHFISNTSTNYEFDFSEVKGQENVKRALEISAAGGHNCLLIRKPWLWKNYVSS